MGRLSIDEIFKQRKGCGSNICREIEAKNDTSECAISHLQPHSVSIQLNRK